MDDHKINLPANGSEAEMELTEAIKKHTATRLKAQGLQVSHANTTIKCYGYRKEALKRKLDQILTKHYNFSYEGEDKKKNALEWKSEATRVKVTLNFSVTKNFITVCSRGPSQTDNKSQQQS